MLNLYLRHYILQYNVSTLKTKTEYYQITKYKWAFNIPTTLLAYTVHTAI
jgi:hypothetical protein